MEKKKEEIVKRKRRNIEEEYTTQLITMAYAFWQRTQDIRNIGIMGLYPSGNLNATTT